MTNPQQSRLLIPILCLLMALGIFSTSLYLPSLPAVGFALGASQEAVQHTLAVFFLGSAIGSLLLGPLADQMGRLVVAKGGILLFILTSFWCAESQTILSLDMARFLQGIAASSGSLVARAMGRDLYKGSDLTRFSSLVMMVISISPAIAPTLGGIIQAYWGWEKNFYFLVGFGCVIAAMVWRWLPETNGARKETQPSSSTFKNYKHILKDPYYGALCLVIATQMISIFCYLSLSPYFFISLFEWSPQQYGYVGVTSAFGNITGFAMARHLANRIHFHQGIWIGSLLSLLFAFLFILSSVFYPFQAFILILYMVCFFGASALVVVNASAASMNLFPKMAGTSAAVIGTVQIGSGAIGSFLGSFLPVSPLALGIAMGILSLISFITGIFLKKEKWLGR